MKTEQDNYIPFGEEWKKELMKWRKSDLVDHLRKTLIEMQELRRRMPSANPVK